MEAGLRVLKPSVTKEAVGHHIKVVIGTVSTDLHDIGKNLVGMMLEGVGFEVVDLGTDVTLEKFVTAMQDMKSTIKRIEELGLPQKVKIIIGGTPATEDFAREIGADGYTTDATMAVTVANSLTGGR